MATNTLNAQLTLAEVAKRTLNGEQQAPVMILSRSKPALMHADWLEANDGFSNVTTQFYNHPSGSWRKFNAGVPSATSQSTQIRDQIGMLEHYEEHDCQLVDSQANPAQFRNEQNAGAIEGLGQTWASQLWYGNALVDPEKWTGLAPRLATLNSLTVQGCNGTGSDVSSIYFIRWSPRDVHMVFPRGSTIGLQHRDLGEETKVDSSGNMWQVYRDHFKWHGGLVVRNPRSIGRLANIETAGSSNIFDYTVVTKILVRLLDQGAGYMAYCSPTIYAQILNAIAAKSNCWFNMQSPWGDMSVPSLMGRIPVFADEMIVDTETAIS